VRVAVATRESDLRDIPEPITQTIEAMVNTQHVQIQTARNRPKHPVPL
jgi:hypothetical protein